MNLLYIANSRIPTEKAHGFQIMKTIEAFIDEGVSVDLLIPVRRNHIKEGVVKFYDLKKSPHIIYIKNYFGLIETFCPAVYFPVQRFIFTWFAFIYVIFSGRKIIYTREITLAFLLSLFGKKVLFEDHEPKNKFIFIYKFFIKHIYKKIVVAENLLKLYENSNVPRSSYIFVPNGVDLKEYDAVSPDRGVWRKIGLTGSEKIILYIGHFYKWKGVYTLLDAAQHVSSGTIVLIGGTKEDKSTVDDYIQKNKIENVKVVPFLPHHEIVKFTKSADVLVLPNTASEERSLRYTTPIKLFEYMASGVPIVASNVESFKFYLKDNLNAFLFEPDNSESLGIKINELLSDAGLCKIVSMKASHDVKEFTWGKRAESILHFIDKR